ncbi:adenylosuccinate synthetase, partial [Streptomyces brasiliscabiei]
DVIYGAAWGDEGKGKICTRLAKDYDATARFNGGPNAGHTFYIDGQKIVTHVVPTGIAFNKPSIIGPNCVIDKDGLYEELDYLKALGFDT